MIRKLIVCLIAGTSIANAGVIYVNKSAAAGGDGLTWATAYNELEHGLAAATSGDEVWIAQGVYTPDIAPLRTLSCHKPWWIYDSLRTRSFVIPDGVSLFGGFLGNESMVSQRSLGSSFTILSGDFSGNDDPMDLYTRDENSTQILVTNPSTQSDIYIDNVTVTGGAADIIEAITGFPILDYAVGGGLRNQGDNITLVDVVFSYNSATEVGGAIHSSDGDLSLIRCQFEHNYIDENVIGFGGGCDLGITEEYGASAVYFTNPTNVRQINMYAAQTSFQYNTTPDNKGVGTVLTGGYTTADFIECTFDNNSGGGNMQPGHTFAQVASALHSVGNVRIANSMFSNNYGGSSLYILHSLGQNTIEVANTVFLDNNTVQPFSQYSGSGGAVFVGSLTTVHFDSCHFIGNSVGGSGGALTEFGKVDIVDCVFSQNTAWKGGAIYGSPDISRSIFAANTATNPDGSSDLGKGGALYTSGGTPHAVVDNCLFYENIAETGAAIFTGGSSLKSVINSTISGNVSLVSAGGFANRYGSPIITNSIIWGNTAPGSALDAQIKDLGSGTVIVDYSCIEDPASSYGGLGMVYADPQFVDAANTDFRLSTNTPCRDVGDNTALDIDSDGIDDIVVDLESSNRLQGEFNEVDMGAYERCFGDYNDDGDLNFLDASLFLSDFGQGNLAADINHDGELNFIDVSKFLILFGVGCN